jgi:hypothetical protein
MGFFKKLFALPIIIMKVLGKLISTIPKLLKALIGFVVTFVTKIIPLIVKFIMNIGVIFQTLMYYLSNPTKLFSFIINILLFIPVMFLSIFYYIPIETGFTFGDFFMYSLISVFYSGLLFALAVLYWVPLTLFGEYTILFNLDKMLKGSVSSFYYRYFAAIENPPDGWYMTPGYHIGNKNIRSIFAYEKCPQGYKPNGLFCEKMKYFEPSYCVSAHIYRQHVDDDSNIGLYYPGNFKQTRDFLRQNTDKQLDIMENYRDIVKEHQLRCDSAHNNKAHLVKSICKQTNNTVMKGLCHEEYCSNKNEPFCHRLNLNTALVNNVPTQTSNTFIIVKVILFILIMIIVGEFKKNR